MNSSAPRLHQLRGALILLAAFLFGLGGCATRPVNPPLEQFDANKAYQIERPERGSQNPQDLVILAFSGGGTRAAAFSYGVLETLRRTEVVTSSGREVRMLDEVDAITGISGGSFTALAYGLYGDKLFDKYEKSFLKRDIQGEIVSRTLSPLNWGALSSTAWGRSELAANLYDEALFNGATFTDLERANGPLIAVSATDLATGSRVSFTRLNFDVLCADLGPVPLSRAAAASSAVPVVLSPVTINNYGGTCGYQEPPWVRGFRNATEAPRPAQRMVKRLLELEEFQDSTQEPYLHLVDGAVSDNLGLRGVLEIIETYEAVHAAGQPTPLDHVRRIIIFVVNATSSPRLEWNKSEEPPGTLDILVKASGVPVDRYSSESVELLKDIASRWRAFRQIRDSPAFTKGKDPAVAFVLNAPDADIYAIDVSFPALKDKAERDYLNELPTSFVLPDEAVDRLRRAAATIIIDSPEFQRVLKDAGARVLFRPD